MSGIGSPFTAQLTPKRSVSMPKVLAQKHGISAQQARELIEKHGNDRETLDRAAARLKG